MGGGPSRNAPSHAACRVHDASPFANDYLSCSGYSGYDVLYPHHEKKGEAPLGAICFVNLQCESGYCSSFYGTCGQCQRTRVAGESCGTPIDTCLDSTCVNGLCQQHPGTALGGKCTQYGGGSGCQQGLVCKTIEPNGFAGFCMVPGGVGFTCGSSNECVEAPSTSDSIRIQLIS